jgi:hypothetical protein
VDAALTMATKRRAVFDTIGQPDLLEGITCPVVLYWLRELPLGEVVLACVDRTLKFERLSERGTGSMGALFVTNYKLTFQSAERSSYDIVSLGYCWGWVVYRTSDDSQILAGFSCM